VNVRNILSWIVSGLLIGLCARLLLPGSDARLGLIGTILAGVAGSFVGGFLGTLRRRGKVDNPAAFQPAGCLMSVIGTILVLLLLRML